MSERGLALLIQRLHDDPGFAGRIADDPQGTLGLYDLDDYQRQVVASCCISGDDTALHDMAEQAGLQWHKGHFHGVGAPPDEEPGAGPKRRR